MKFDIVGDIHGCLEELFELLQTLGYESNGFLFNPPEGRLLVLVGDLVDRGDYSIKTYNFIREMVNSGRAIMCLGNHDEKLMRWAKGNKVKLLHGLDKTVESLIETKIPNEEIVDFFSNIPYYLFLDDLIVVHASWEDWLISYDRFEKKCKNLCLHGPSNGFLENGLVNRVDWALNRKLTDRSYPVVCGHQVFDDVRIINNVYQIDTGCVYGGKLSCLKWPEKEIVQVKSKKEYSPRYPK